MKTRLLPALIAGLLPAIFVAHLHAAPTHLVNEAPARIGRPAPGVQLVDFGRVSFGNLRLRLPAGQKAEVVVHFGEDLVDGRINRKPPGTVRYYAVPVTITDTFATIAPPPDRRNTWTGKTNWSQIATMPGAPATPPPPAILVPESWGVVLPFRWVEIEGLSADVAPGDLIRQSAYASTWDDQAASFTCSDETLNRIWELCRYTIKATTFAGLYVDGDRERIPYEADAYLNQITHYYTDSDKQMARDTYDHLMIHGTWPTEWASHMVFMAHADWLHTGDKAWLSTRYDALRSKLLRDRVNADGLVASTEKHIAKGDIVDWPKGERDGFVFTPLNSVVNAFALRSLEQMVEMGRALGKDAAVAEYSQWLAQSRAAYQARFFDPATGLCRDGVGTDHSSLHANLFALAFGLAPAEHAAKIRAWLLTRGMDCSVYVAQYYMEALFQAGAGQRALDLMLAPGDRSWRHMLASNTTITWEAWDQKYKPNQDWNHAWGAAPGNLLPRFILGVEPAAPGWAVVSIAPQPSGLTRAQGTIPTLHGPIRVSWSHDQHFQLRIELPASLPARVKLPAPRDSKGVNLNGKPTPATRQGDWWIVAQPVSGQATLDTF